MCPEGKILRRVRTSSALTSRACRRADLPVRGASERLSGCPVTEGCLPPKQKRRYFTLTMYYPEYLRARERNQRDTYRQELRRRQTIAEGTFASQDHLSWARSRLRGLWKVDWEGYMAAVAHNVKKLVRKLSRSVGPLVLALPPTPETTESGSTGESAIPASPVPPPDRLRRSRSTKIPSLRTPQSHCGRRLLSHHYRP